MGSLASTLSIPEKTMEQEFGVPRPGNACRSMPVERDPAEPALKATMRRVKTKARYTTYAPAYLRPFSPATAFFASPFSIPKIKYLPLIPCYVARLVIVEMCLSCLSWDRTITNNCWLNNFSFFPFEFILRERSSFSRDC